jgi:hypothetical protein
VQSPKTSCSTEHLGRLVTLYQTLHDAIHARSGQEGPLKLQYIRTDTESVMGWVCGDSILSSNLLVHVVDPRSRNHSSCTLRYLLDYPRVLL